MKKITLFLLTLMVSVVSAFAQTQLQNADFAEGVIGDVNIATYAKDGEVNQMQAVPGWAFGVENGDARAAGVVAYGSGTTLGGADYKVPAAGPEGTNGNALGLVGVWTGTVKYVQDVTLSAGKYTMTVPVYNTAGTTAFVKNLIGVKYGETEVLASTKLYPVGKWTDETVVFELAEETNVTVSLGYEGANVSSGASQHLFYDCVKIEAYDELAVAKAAALAALPVADASIFTPNTEDVEAVKAAIEAATTVAEVEAAAATEFEIPALSGEWQIKNTNGDVYLGEAKISAEAISTTFEKAEGGFYINVSGKYVNFVGTGNNKWSMGVSETASTVWNFNLADGKYTIQGPNGLIGSDDLNDGSATYCDKKITETNKNIFWTVEEYVDPNAKQIELIYTLDTSLDENKGTDNGYATACDVTVDGVTWNVTGNATMAPWRLGGKSLDNVDRVVKTTTAYAGDVQKVVLTLGDVVNGIAVNSVTLAYADNADFTDAKTIVKEHATSLEFAPEGGFGANMFYQFAVNVTVPGTGNKYVTFDKVEFYGYAPEEETTWDGETVVTSLDEATVTKLSDLDGMTITLPGAKSIEMIDIEEIGYLSLQNQNGSEIYGIWSPSYGTTCSIDGETITLSSFVTLEEVTTDIPAGTTKLYIEDYGTFIVDGDQDVRYLPTIELTANIAGAAEPFAIVVSNDDVEGTAEGVEASENGVYYQFNVTAQGKALSKGTGVPTLSLLEDATVDFGAANLIAYEAQTAYVRFMTLQVPYFTMPGTYVLNIPEGTFVDAEGTPNAEVTLKWVIVQGDDDQENKDITSKYIVNADLSNGLNGWTAVTFNTPAKQANSGYATEAYAGWGALDVTEYSLTQKITLPAGSYKLTNNSFFRQAGGAKDNAEKSLAYLVAGEEQVLIKTLGSIDAKAYANSQIEGAGVLSSGKAMYFNEIDFTLAEETEIEIGIKGTFDEMKSWMIASGFHLYDMNFTAASKEDVSDLIANNSFENGTEGWTVEGEWAEQNNGEAAKVGTRYVEKWQASGQLPDASIMQTLTDLQNGKYILSAVVHSLGEGAFLVANGDRTEVTTAASLQTVETEVTDGTLTIGFVRDNYQANWIAVDNFTLVYCAPGKAEPQTINIETVEVGETEPNEYGDQFYTVTLTVPAEDIAGLGVAHAFCEGIQLTDGETTCTFVATAVDGIDVTEGENVVFTCKDAMPCCTSDAEYEGDFRQAGTYQGTCTIVLTDADYNEIGAAVFEGEVILPTATGINEVKFNVTNVVYTINGVRVQKPVKGVNIINGKKVVVK